MCVGLEEGLIKKIKKLLTNGVIRYKFSTADTIFCVIIHKYIQHMVTSRLFLFLLGKKNSCSSFTPLGEGINRII